MDAVAKKTMLAGLRLAGLVQKKIRKTESFFVLSDCTGVYYTLTIQLPLVKPVHPSYKKSRSNERDNTVFRQRQKMRPKTAATVMVIGTLCFSFSSSTKEIAPMAIAAGEIPMLPM